MAAKTGQTQHVTLMQHLKWWLYNSSHTFQAAVLHNNRQTASQVHDLDNKGYCCTCQVLHCSAAITKPLLNTGTHTDMATPEHHAAALTEAGSDRGQTHTYTHAHIHAPSLLAGPAAMHWIGTKPTGIQTAAYYNLYTKLCTLVTSTLDKRPSGPSLAGQPWQVRIITDSMLSSCKAPYHKPHFRAPCSTITAPATAVCTTAPPQAYPPARQTGK